VNTEVLRKHTKYTDTGAYSTENVDSTCIQNLFTEGNLC